MNEESKKLYELILYRYVKDYKDLKEKGVEITSVYSYNNEIYIIEMKNTKGETYKTELPNNVIQHFIDTFKVPDNSKIILDKNLNFKQIFENENK